MKKLMLSLVGALVVTSATVADDNEPEVYEFTKATASSKAPYVLPKNVTNEATKIIRHELQDGGIIKKAINGKVADIDLGAKRDKTDELVYSQTEVDWDFSEVTKVNPSKIYEIKINPNTGADDVVTYSYTLWGSDASGSGTVCELEAHPDDVAGANPTRLVVKSALDADVPSNSIYRSLVGTVIYKRGVLTGDTLAHESEKADSEVSTVYATINSTNVVIGSAKGVPIRNMTWYYNRDNVGNIKLYNKDSGTLIGSASSYSDWNGSEPSFVATFRINDEELKLKVSNSSVSLKTGDSWGTPASLICGMRVAKDSKRLGGKTAAEWEALISSPDVSSKRDIRDEYHYALEWDFTEFNAIKDNVGYKVAKDEDNEYIWKVYKVVPGEDDVAIANCSKVDPEEEEPTKLKIIVADLTDGDYAGLVDKIISAYPSKTTDKFALKSDITNLNDASANKADAALYGSKSEVITVNGHDVVVSIENGYAAKYIPLGFDGANLNVKFYLTVDGSKIEIPFDSCNDEACDDENDIYNTFTMISFGGDNFPEELTNLGITSVKIEYVSGSSDYSSSRFKYTINGTKESSTSIDVKNPAQAADSRKFDGKSAMDWVNTFLPLYFYNKTDADAEFHNKYYVDSNVVTGKIDGVFFEARVANGSNVRVVLRGATLPIADILSWTNKTDCIELYASNNFSVAYSNPEVYQISTSGSSLGFNIRFPDFPNVGIHLEGNVAYIGNAIAPEYKFIGGVGKPYTPWHNPGLAPNSHKFAGRTYEEAAEDAAERLELRLGHFVNTTNELTIGSGATNENHKEAITFNGCLRYPSYTWGFANINIGLDNVAGFGDNGVGGVKQDDNSYTNTANYDVVIGTSSSAKYMHSYVFGSQSHALARNSFIFGYGATTEHPNSTVVGFGERPTADVKFNTFNDLNNYLKSFSTLQEASANLFVDMMLTVTNDVSHLVGVHRSDIDLNGDYYIKELLSAKDSDYGWARLYKYSPHTFRDEYIRGRHNWKYGHSNGDGTFNIIAKGDGVNNYGFANVYINGIALTEWTGIHCDEPNMKWKYVNGVPTEQVLCAHDRTVCIGNNARVTEPNPALASIQSVGIGRDVFVTGTASTGVGPNAEIHGNFGVAVGWRSAVIGDYGIAIGTGQANQDYYTNGVHNTLEDLTLAEAPYTIAIGTRARAHAEKSIVIGGYHAETTAKGAVQIGDGTNRVENSFQVQDYLLARKGELMIGDVAVVRNGELVGGVSEATEIDFSENEVASGELNLVLKSGSNVTLLPTTSFTDVEELAITPFANKRNYTITLPNEPNVCDGLPITIVNELPAGMKSVFRNGNITATKLPAQIKCEQPYSKLCIFTVEEMDDDTDWTPNITRCNIGFSSTTGKFFSYGSTAFRGTNLQCAKSIKIKYPINNGASTFTTNVVDVLNDKGYTTGSLYRRVSFSEFTPNPVISAGSGNSPWFEVEYETINGVTNLARKTFVLNSDLETEGIKRLTGEVVWSTTGGDNMANGNFILKTSSSGGSLVDPNEVVLKYILSNNTTNTVKMANLTYNSTEGGYVSAGITGLKIGAINTVTYKTIDSDVEVVIQKVVNNL